MLIVEANTTGKGIEAAFMLPAAFHGMDQQERRPARLSQSPDGTSPPQQ